MKLILKMFDASTEALSALSETFGDCSSVELIKTEKVLYLKPPSGLDLLYLPLAAAERWGAKPLIHKSQILTTNESEQQEGLPPYLATGTCLDEEDPRGPMPETRLLVQAVFQAIRDFNRENENRIKYVGFWAVDLLRMVSPTDLRKILKDAVPELGLS